MFNLKMALVIPDEILEILTCHVCKKYLSVQPVKVYANKQIRCGRCSRPDDEGVISLYKSVAGQGLFRCINRYDGCNKLLTFAEVQAHEQLCISNKYYCPVCPAVDQFTSFLLVNHFKTEHGNVCLGDPEFVLELSSLECEHVFFYKQYDHLFFVYIKLSTSEDTISFYVAFVGEKATANSMRYKVLMYSQENGDRNLIKISKQKQCVALGKEGTENFKVKYSDVADLKQLIYRFEVDTLAATKFTVLSNSVREPDQGPVQIKNSKPDPIEKVQPPVKNTVSSSHIKYYDPADLEKKLLPQAVLDGPSNDYCISDCGMFLKKKGMIWNTSILELFCCRCREPLNSVLPYQLKGSIKYMCSACRTYFINKDFEPIPQGLPYIKFFCKWRCGQLQRISHDCRNHPLRCQRICPMGGCQVTGTLDELKRHLSETHRVVFTDENCFNSKDFFKPVKYILLLLNRFVLVDVAVIGTWKNVSMSVVDKQYPVIYIPVAIGYTYKDNYHYDAFVFYVQEVPCLENIQFKIILVV